MRIENLEGRSHTDKLLRVFKHYRRTPISEGNKQTLVLTKRSFTTLSPNPKVVGRKKRDYILHPFKTTLRRCQIEYH